jgi:lysine-specific demethylase/histidyl-hydroxylase NO66
MKQKETTASAQDDADGVPVTLQYVERVVGEKASLHTKTLKFTSVHSNLDGHEILKTSTFDSAKKAWKFLSWFLAPLNAKDFLENYWEKRVFVLKRNAIKRADGSHFYSGWWSKDIINTLMENGALKYSTDMDVTLYKDGKRHTLNPQGGLAADPALVWQLYDKVGCSVRVLRPQQYSQKVSSMLALLEESIGQGWGSNSYLTPSKSQGFAPHWDDVEAFVMQLEGRKLWKIHAAKETTEILPRTSSENFSQEEVGEPILQVWLEPGDLMYFPRGTIHQASSASDEHSLHLTVSTGQNNTWADFFERALPNALNVAVNELPEFRASLPVNFGDYMGVMYSDLARFILGLREHKISADRICFHHSRCRRETIAVKSSLRRRPE